MTYHHRSFNSGDPELQNKVDTSDKQRWETPRKRRSSHEIGEGGAAIPFPIEDWGRFANNFLPCLLAFAHVATPREVDFSDRLVADFA